MTFHIRTAADLESLATRRGRVQRPDRIALDVTGFTDADARMWEARLSRYYFACGCEVASVALLLALSAYLVAVAVTPGGLGSATWRDAGIGVVIGFAAAAFGKLVGLLYARRRLRMTIRVLAARVVDLECSAGRVGRACRPTTGQQP
jgi:hypothetical protein